MMCDKNVNLKKNIKRVVFSVNLRRKKNSGFKHEKNNHLATSALLIIFVPRSRVRMKLDAMTANVSYVIMRATMAMVREK